LKIRAGDWEFETGIWRRRVDGRSGRVDEGESEGESEARG